MPTVVGHAGAVDEFREGETITVDGRTGQVSRAGDEGDEGEDPS